jgi:hypothetical protein
MTMRYVSMMQVPRAVGPGRVLMHNHVRHSVDMPCGVNGFRAWTDTEPPTGFVQCPCGWSGLPHYAAHSHVEASKGRRRGRKLEASHPRRLLVLASPGIYSQALIGRVNCGSISIRPTGAVCAPADPPACGASCLNALARPIGRDARRIG